MTEPRFKPGDRVVLAKIGSHRKVWTVVRIYGFGNHGPIYELTDGSAFLRRTADEDDLQLAIDEAERA